MKISMAALTLLLAATAAAQPFDESLYRGMKYRLVGPFRGGRVLAVEGIPGEPNAYYFGAAAGGVWHSGDGGRNWTPLFDKQGIGSIGSIAVAPSDHNVVYVGTGEACLRGNISYGDGVYKSTDGGKSWSHLGLRDTRHIGAVIVHPRNPDLVFVAALGHAFGPNAERGLFRSSDGGRSWIKVLYRDEKTGAIDVVFDPHNANTLFASLWETVRQPHYYSSGGPGSGLYKSIDGGLTWKRLAGDGLPDGPLGRIGVAVSGADGNRVYALIEARDGGLYRSDDGGDKWTKVNDDQRWRQRAWYFTHVYADPRSVDTVYALNTGLFRSTDGGKSFTLLPAPHGDHHALWIDPRDPERMINGNDGGATITVNGGRTWSLQDNQPTAQFYHVSTDTRVPYYIYGAQQDNSAIGIASRDDEGVIGRQDWYDVAGGESGYIVADPRDPWVTYGTDNSGVLGRYDKRTNEYQLLSVWPIDNTGHGASEHEHRFQWTEPVFVSLHEPYALYTAGERVFRSTDQGMSWSAISPDLTRNDKSRQQPSGGPITKDNTGPEVYDTVFALAESPVQKDLLWAGTDDGLVHLTRDGGKSWSNVTPRGMPEWSLISLIDPSPAEPGAAYVAVDRHRLDDLRPYIYVTRDFGKSWRQANSGIPEGAYVHVVRADPKRQGLLFAGTETGVFVSFDDGAHWQRLGLNLPTVPVHDLVVKDDDLVVATHGRSFWVLDDLAPLRQIDARVAKSEMTLYRPAATYRLHLAEWVDRRRPVGDNPPGGAIIDYYFKRKPQGEVTLEVFDSRGQRVKHYSNREKPRFEQPPEWPQLERPPELIPAEQGMNRFAWNLRYEEPTPTPGAFYTGNGPEGPIVMPGVYRIKLTANGQSQTADLEVRIDPRVASHLPGIEKQFALSMKLHERIASLHRAVNQIRDVRAQLQVLRKRIGDEPKGKPVLAAAQELDGRMTTIERELIQVDTKSSEGTLNFPTMLNERFESLRGLVEISDSAPTRQMHEVFDALSRQLDGLLGQWNALGPKSVAALNESIRALGIPMLALEPGK